MPFLNIPNAVWGSILNGVGNLAGAFINSNAAGNAADTQANAANNAAQLQANAAQNALNFQQQIYNSQLGLALPGIQTGQSAQVNLARLLGVLPKDRPATLGTAATPATGTTYFPSDPNGIFKVAPPPDGSAPQFQGYDGNGNPIYNNGSDKSNGDAFPSNGVPAGSGSSGIVQNPGTPGTPGTPADPGVQLSQFVNPDLGAEGSLSQGWTGQFVAPTDVTEQNDPGYQWRLAQGMKALNASAAAKGNLLSGGTLKAGQRYAQDYASNEYGNVYNRALGEYQQGYNQFQQKNTDLYNRLANFSGLGQISAQQLNTAGNNAAGNNTSILLNSAGQIGQQMNNAAYQRGSGYTAQAGAISSGINGTLGGLIDLLNRKGNVNNTSNQGFPY